MKKLIFILLVIPAFITFDALTFSLATFAVCMLIAFRIATPAPTYSHKLQYRVFAQQIFRAITGMGTNEAEIYSVLRKMKNSTDIKLLSQEFYFITGNRVTLEQMLYLEMPYKWWIRVCFHVNFKGL